MFNYTCQIGKIKYFFDFFKILALTFPPKLRTMILRSSVPSFCVTLEVARLEERRAVIFGAAVIQKLIRVELGFNGLLERLITLIKKR